MRGVLGDRGEGEGEGERERERERGGEGEAEAVIERALEGEHKEKGH